MVRVYDNWDRLVRATLRREQLRLIGQRTPSELSVVSSSSSFNFNASFRPVSSFSFPGLLVGETFEYDQILRATDYFSDSNLIRRGRSGDFFHGVLEDGTRVVVKRIDLSLVDNVLSCRSELEFYGKVSHSKLVPLLGYCLEILDEMYLVYKCMPKKDLSSSLHWVVHSNGDSRSGSLDWITRLKIATGVAEALCYLHDECVPPLVHRDIQASSILLDHHYDVRLGSLGEVRTVEGEVNQIRSLQMPMEYKQGPSGTTSPAICAYDVYCFGKVLLELITGKLGISSSNNADVTTENWLEKTLACITSYDKSLVTEIVDPLLYVEEDLLKEVWAMAIVARSCLNPEPSMRPLMRDVLEALENPMEVVRREHPSLLSGRITLHM